MKQGSTLFLKIAVFLIGTPVLALGIFGFTWLPNNPVNPDYAHILYPIVIGMYVSVIPFFVALYQAFKLLSYIDRNQAFSELSVKALKKIKFCALTISGLYVVHSAICVSRSRFRRCPRSRNNRNGPYLCFNGNRSICCCSSKTFTRSD